MAKVTFKNLDLQSVLFPTNILDKIPANHPVLLVDSIVNQLDLSSIVSLYKGGGTSSFHPRMMIKVLFYAYLNNIYSCRKIEKALKENIYFMWLSGNSEPDYRTINYFRSKRLSGHLEQLFAEVVKLLHNENCVSLEKQYIDGTKIESAANRYTFVWRGSVEKNKAKLETKIISVLSEIEEQIAEDNQSINEVEVLPTIDTASLKEKVAAINEKLELTGKQTKNTTKQLKKLTEEQLPKLAQYEDQLIKLDGRNSYSKTDEDATFLRLKDDHMKNGQLKPAYNTQISTENQYITHYSIHQTANDTNTLKSHLESFEANYNTQSKEVIADAGYGSEENYSFMEANNITPFVKYNYFHKEQKRNHKNNPFVIENMFYNEVQDFYVCPMGQRLTCTGTGNRTSKNGFLSTVKYYQAQRCEGCPLRGMCHKSKGNRKIEVNNNLIRHKQKAKELLTSEQGLAHRSKRPIEVEAVFGQLKSNNRFTRFTHRGLEKVSIEFGLMAIGHNLRKLTQKAANERKKALCLNYLNLSVTINTILLNRKKEKHNASHIIIHYNMMAA